MKKYKVLILEDDIRSLRFILSVIDELGEEKNISFAVTILSDYIQVQEYINKNPDYKYDILFLDRDCFLGGSFHVVNLDQFDMEKTISISSVPEYNRNAIGKGIKRAVLKRYDDLLDFKNNLKNELSKII